MGRGMEYWVWKRPEEAGRRRCCCSSSVGGPPYPGMSGRGEGVKSEEGEEVEVGVDGRKRSTTACMSSPAS